VLKTGRPPDLETTMDLNFTPQEQAFRSEIRAWVAENLPQDISHKVHHAFRLSRDDLQRWAKILGKKGWLGYGWPKEHGGPGWNAVQRHLFEEELAMAGAPRIIPFGPVMVAPVIMAFGSPEQQKRHLPGIMSGEVWWSQGYSEPGAGSDLASLKTRAERRGDKYIVNGQKTWTTLGQYGEWIFCLVRTGTEGKPQTGISFLLIDMKSPGITVRPIITLDGEHEVNEVFFDNVEVPAENLVGEENKGWTYAKYLLGHERTNIADVNRAKRELERLKRIAKSEGVYDDVRFRDQIALLEVDIVALEMMVLRVLSAETGGKKALDVAGLLKIRGSEIQQRYTELMMLAGGPYTLPFIHEAMEAGWQGDHVGAAYLAPLASTYFNHRKTTIYGGSNEVQRNIVSQVVLGS
jgi:alkylation response protein AidB-like acyl-CoA dehydrogenase